MPTVRKRLRPDEVAAAPDDGDCLKQEGEPGSSASATSQHVKDEDGQDPMATAVAPEPSSSTWPPVMLPPPPPPPPPPPELASVDFSARVRWGKFCPYADDDRVLPTSREDEPPAFAADSPALCHRANGLSHRARACTIHLRPQPGQQKQQQPVPIRTPMFMPVGTKGCLKAVPFEEWTSDPALACPIVLANTYHLAIQPGTELVRDFGGLHAFQHHQQLRTEGTEDGMCAVATETHGGVALEGAQKSEEEEEVPGDGEGDQQRGVRYNLLTDSGGFQMVSLAKLSQVTEDGVLFENPFRANKGSDPDRSDLMLLRPEDSIRHQNNIGANIIMALDDVVSSVTDDPDRFVVATHRTLRWYDRCYEAHAKKGTQNLFPIVQGGLDTSLGGLREQCLAGFRHRQLELKYQIPGYSIGGLAGGESKDQFWRVVDQCCRALPDDKPRYLMGVGYPLDLVVCTALGVDLYDCVYPTRTARFGVCLVPGKAPGTLKLKSRSCADDARIVQEGCRCQPCRWGVSRARLHGLLKAGNPLAVELVTQHNIAHMMSLVRSMRQAILQDAYGDYARTFVREQYPGKQNGGEDPPGWVVDALEAAGICLS